MDLLSLLWVLVRRWYLTVPLLVASIVGVVLVVGTGPSGYKVNGTMVLLPPQTVVNTDPKAPAGSTTKINPFLQVDSASLTIVAGLLATQMASAPFQATVDTSAAVHPTWTVAQESGVPVLDLSVIDTTGPGAVRGATLVFNQAEIALRNMQAHVGAPIDQRATVVFSNVPTKGTAQYGHTVKVGGALAVVSLGLSAAFVFIVDAVLGRRKKRKRRKVSSRAAAREADAAAETAVTENAPAAPAPVPAPVPTAPAPSAAAPAAPTPAGPPSKSTEPASFSDRTPNDASELGYARREH